MKKQSEELIFKYKIKPQKDGTHGVLFELPLNYHPLPGDIIELIISENENTGGVDYYARLVCFPVPEDLNKQVAVLDGRIENNNGEMVNLYSSYLKYYENGYAIVLSLETDGTIVPPFVGENDCIVNLIVYRSKSKLELYWF